MEQVSHLPRLAVLIDGENISSKLAGRVFEEAERFGLVVERRVYGDFCGSAKPWSDAALLFALDERHCSRPAPGKNGVDIKLAIETVDLLNRGGIDGVCIVSSDSDFTELAKHVRQRNCRAYGFGNAPAASRFRAACTEYVTVVEAAEAETPQAIPHAALAGIRSLLEEAELRDGWYCLCGFGTVAKRAGMCPGKFGARKLSDLLRATGQFEVDTSTAPGRFRPVGPRLVKAAG